MKHRDEALVTIATFPTSMEASLARGALEAVGIRAWVPDEALGSFTQRWMGGASCTLKVFESDCDKAVAEIRRLNFKIVT